MRHKINKDIDNQKIPRFINSYFHEIQTAMSQIDEEILSQIIKTIMKAYYDDKYIYILGNGGSASLSSHMACDLSKGTLRRVYDKKEKRLHVLSLTDNVATITAYGNDISYDNIFVQQLQNLLKPNDIVIAISGSGNSKNVIKAVTYTKKIGAISIGLTGFETGGKLAQLADISLVVKSHHYGPIEDIHLMLSHLITACIASIKYEESHKKIKKNMATPFSIKEKK